MLRRATSAALAFALLAWATPAAADDDHLEDDFARDGLMLAFGVGGGGVAGGAGDSEGQRGGGGSGTFRIGTSAGENLLWMVQIDSQQFIEDTETSLTDVHTTFTIAGQYYVREILWLKAGLGTSTLRRREVDPDDDTMTITREQEGLGLMGSSGYDVLRFSGSWAVNLESTIAIGLFSDGAAVQLSINAVLTRY